METSIPMKCSVLINSRLLPSLLNTGLVSLMTVRATNDKLADATTRAPRRSSLPQGNRSIASALWINDPSRFSEIFGSESVPLGVGARFLFNSVTSAARRIALVKLQGNRRACYGGIKIQGVDARLIRRREATLLRADGREARAR